MSKIHIDIKYVIIMQKYIDIFSNVLYNISTKVNKRTAFSLISHTLSSDQLDKVFFLFIFIYLKRVIYYR